MEFKVNLEQKKITFLASEVELEEIKRVVKRIFPKEDNVKIGFEAIPNITGIPYSHEIRYDYNNDPPYKVTCTN